MVFFRCKGEKESIHNHYTLLKISYIIHSFKHKKANHY